MERQGTTTDPGTAAAQLASLRAARAAAARHAMQPWSYDALLGLLVFGLIASYSAREDWVTPVALLVLLGGVLCLVPAYERTTGLRVNGLRPGRTRKAARVWLAGYVVVLALAGGLEYGPDRGGVMVVAGVLLGVGVALLSRWWSRLYVAELRDEL